MTETNIVNYLQQIDMLANKLDCKQRLKLAIELLTEIQNEKSENASFSQIALSCNIFNEGSKKKTKITFELEEETYPSNPSNVIEDIEVFVKTVDNGFGKSVNCPKDMLVDYLLEASREQAGLPPVEPCGLSYILVLERANKVLKNSDTIQDAGINSGDTLLLVANAEGG